MAAGQRPGGLTALAILNFVWGGILGLFLLVAVIGAAATQKAADSDIPVTITTTNAAGEVETRVATKDEVKTVAGTLWILNLILAVVVLLLILSGIGYLGQKRILGRLMGNLYALGSIGASALMIAESGFGFVVLILLVYPVLTLLLLNTAFKDDLVN